MSTKQQYETLANMCQELFDLGPEDRGFGICYNLSVRNKSVYIGYCAPFDEIVEHWPHYSGSLIYPVPGDGTPYDDPGDCFNGTPDLWEGRQGELRYNLLEFVVATCKDRILTLSFPERDIGPFRALLVE